MSASALGVIPVRLAASRLPRKPLLPLGGRPIVQWVWEAAVGSGVFQEVVVATPDIEIANVVSGFGGVVCMTSADHVSGSDRVAEVAMGRDHSLVANVQGDQPFVTTEMLQVLMAAFDADPTPDMTTIATPLRDDAERFNPNTVKVVCDSGDRALYFSRAPIPYPNSGTSAPTLHHLGLYAFRRSFLAAFTNLPIGPLEAAEGLEQLRALEHGHHIRVGTVSAATIEINTESDLHEADRLVAEGAS